MSSTWDYGLMKHLNFDIHLEVVDCKITYAVGILNKLKEGFISLEIFI